MPLHYTPEFEQQIRRIGRRYRSIRQGLQGLIEQLQAGEVPGDQISGIYSLGRWLISTSSTPASNDQSTSSSVSGRKASTRPWCF